MARQTNRQVALRDAAAAMPRVSGPRVYSVADGYANVATGMGTDKDKATQNIFTFAEQDRGQLEFAYRGDWISRKCVDIPAYDATREWRSWEGDADDITALEDLETRMGIQRKTFQALSRARLYGGSALVIGVDDGLDPSEPLVLEALGIDCLKFVHVISRHDMSASELETDIMSPWYGQPKFYTRNTTAAGSVRVHPSRVCRFIGNEVPDITLAQGWGDSVLNAVADAILTAGSSIKAIGQLVQEAKIDIVHIPELSERLVSKDYEDRLKARFAMANSMKSIYSLLLIDKEEEWERVSQAFVGMPEVAQMFLQVVSGAVDIPATRFLSQAPAGMNATGDSDTRNYYDRVSTEQNITVRPGLATLDDVLVISALGSKPDGLYYTWNPLWQMDETAKTTIALQKAQIMTADVGAGLMNSLTLQKARENQLIEDGTYPGLEQIIDEFGDDVDERGPTPEEMAAQLAAQQAANSNDPNAPPAFGKKGPPGSTPPGSAKSNVPPAQAVATKAPVGSPPRKAANDGLDDDMAARVRAYDAASPPRSLYVRRDVTPKSAKAIVAHYKEQGLASIVKDLHATVMFSKTPVDWLKAGGEGWEGDTLTLMAGGPRVMQQFGKATVMSFANSQLSWRHEAIKRAGAQPSHPDYTPHLTLTYALPDGIDIDKITMYQGEIVFGPEIWETIDDSFDNNTDVVEDVNPFHDPDTGRFTNESGAGSGPKGGPHGGLVAYSSPENEKFGLSNDLLIKNAVAKYGSQDHPIVQGFKAKLEKRTSAYNKRKSKAAPAPATGGVHPLKGK